MIQFKIGDIVECIESISVGSGGPKKGELYEVKSIQKLYNTDYSIGIHCPKLSSGYNNNIRLGKQANWGHTCFKLSKKKIINMPMNEIDWLNRVQQNFKE
jgi:hypothetical protein